MKDKIFQSKDKQITPFLLTQQNINFLGTELIGHLIFFNFSPYDKCQSLINEFMTYKAPLVQPKKLLDAVESYRDRVFEMKEKYHE